MQSDDFSVDAKRERVMSAECPKGKVQFATLEAANVARSSLAMKNRKQGKRVKVRAYICPDCGQWHVGRGPSGKDSDWSTRKLFKRERVT